MHVTLRTMEVVANTFHRDIIATVVLRGIVIAGVLDTLVIVDVAVAARTTASCTTVSLQRRLSVCCTSMAAVRGSCRTCLHSRAAQLYADCHPKRAMLSVVIAGTLWAHGFIL